MIKPCNSRRMMLAVLMVAASNRVQAQAYEPPNLKMVVFGGFSSVSLKAGPNLDRISVNGWTVSVTNYSTFRRWGLTAEFGGEGKAGTSHRTYLFGGTYRAFQRKRLGLTGRILAGATQWDPKAPESGAYREQTAFTFGFGQAIDFKLSENFAFRVQPDLRFARIAGAAGATKTTFVRPISVGFVYQFGQR